MIETRMRLAFPATFTLGVLLNSNAQLTSAEPIQFQSGVTQAAFIELYTSDGCSSCPPAEDWLSRLRGNPKLWKDFVPVAFHVDYWDHLGWKDAFSSRAWSERQSDYATQWHNDTVYTPGFVLSGNEWRDWSNGVALPRPALKPVGVLTARSENSMRWSLRFHAAPGVTLSSCDFHIALLGFDLVSDVTAGENRGRSLRHDFVVIALSNAASSRSGEILQGVLSLSGRTDVSPKRLAIAAWVTPSKTLRPLQALGGWLPSADRVP